MVIPKGERGVSLASVVKKGFSKEWNFIYKKKKTEQKKPRRESFPGHCPSPNLG